MNIVSLNKAECDAAGTALHDMQGAVLHLPVVDDPSAIGWIGNSTWGRVSKGYDVRGFNRLFEPTMAALTGRGLAVEPKIDCPAVNRIAFEDIPAFYRDLDVFV